MKDIQPEPIDQTIEEAAKQEIPELKHIINTVSDCRKIWIAGVKSEAARNYWTSILNQQQKNDLTN